MPAGSRLRGRVTVAEAEDVPPDGLRVNYHLVIEIEGGQICVEQGWTHGPRLDLGRRWESAEVGDALRKLIAEGAPPEPVYGT